MQTETMPVAAIVHAGKGQADSVLLAFIDRLQRQGLTVRGLVPGPQSDPGDCATRTVRDLETGIIYPIAQDLGKESSACCLDPGALVAAAPVLRRAIAQRPDLAIVNRYGVLEADGKGFADEMLTLMAEGIPMLTVVSPSHLEDWRRFTGGMAAELKPELPCLLDWTRLLREPGAA